MEQVTQYKETGNKYPIPVNELLAYAQEKLQEFDMMVEATKTQPSTSPYTDPIIYATGEGKLVQIPEYIQEQAIQLWNNQKQGLTDVSNNAFNEELSNNDIDILSEDIEGIYDTESKKDKGNNYILYLVIVVLLAILAYISFGKKYFQF
jgi:hypothetical protein